MKLGFWKKIKKNSAKNEFELSEGIANKRIENLNQTARSLYEFSGPVNLNQNTQAQNSFVVKVLPRLNTQINSLEMLIILIQFQNL